TPRLAPAVPGGVVAAGPGQERESEPQSPPTASREVTARPPLDGATPAPQPDRMPGAELTRRPSWREVVASATNFPPLEVSPARGRTQDRTLAAAPSTQPAGATPSRSDQ